MGWCLAALPPRLQTPSKEIFMKLFRPAPARVALASMLVAASFAAISAHAADSQCVVAGRLNADQQWAPRTPGIELLNQDGKPVTASSREALSLVKKVRISRPSLLSLCDGNKELAADSAGAAAGKTAVPAVSADKALLAVEAVAFPKLRNGELVELQLVLPAQRVVMLSR
jgi:hypothetical protein